MNCYLKVVGTSSEVVLSFYRRPLVEMRSQEAVVLRRKKNGSGRNWRHAGGISTWSYPIVPERKRVLMYAVSIVSLLAQCLIEVHVNDEGQVAMRARRV